MELPATNKCLAFFIPLLIHFVVGNFVEPYIFGDKLDLHPIVVLLALGLWAIVWGVSGMILAVPIFAVVGIVMRECDHPVADVIVQILEGNFDDLQPTPFGSPEDNLQHSRYGSLNADLANATRLADGGTQLFLKEGDPAKALRQGRG
jgi:hypothetical protein